MTWREGVRRAGRWLAAAWCGVLALGILFMALAVLVQALAVLVQALAVLALALMAAVLLLPHPPAWYAERGGEAAGAFFCSLLRSAGLEKSSDVEEHAGAGSSDADKY